MRKAVLRRIAALWQYTYRIKFSLGKWSLRYGSIGNTVLLLFLVIISVCLSPSLQDTLERHYNTEGEIERLRELILSTGSALIGAAAIVASLVLFATQINIERMPHGLFRRLSEDRRLLGAFLLAFILAIAVTILSAFVDQFRLAPIVLMVSWFVFFILYSFVYAYRRALVLINPLEQLRILNLSACKELRTWARWAKWAKPLLESEESMSVALTSRESTHDLTRTAFFRINSQWADGAKRAILHAMSFARRYAEQGDYEISGEALNSVVGINAEYIATKGKTFYASSPFVENRLSSDSIIIDTLEHLRQNVQRGIVHKDEQQIEQTLRTMAALIQVYLRIDYSSPYATKSDAQLAAGYLTSAIEAVVPHDMADVLMEGQRLMGSSAQKILAHGDLNDIAVLSEKIALIASTGCVKEVYHPVMMEGMTQLANLTFELLRYKNNDIHFMVERVRRDVALVAKLFLNVTDTPLTRIHSTYLGPYYSPTSTQSLRVKLTLLANTILEAQPDDVGAKTVIRNIEQWSDGLHQTEKDLLLAAIKARSNFTFDMIHWVADVTNILLVVSNSPACDNHSREELRNHANWLIASLTWITDDEETVKFVESFQITEKLFEAAMDARKYGCADIAWEIGKYLLSWTFKGGKYQTGWGILKRGLFSLAVFALMCGDKGVSWITTEVKSRLASNSAPDQETRNRTARGILERVEKLHQRGHESSRIDMAIARSDHGKLRPILVEIAGLLSPGIEP